jgi:integrase
MTNDLRKRTTTVVGLADAGADQTGGSMPRKPKKVSRPRRRGRRDFGTIKSHGTPTEPLFSVRWWEGTSQRRRRGFTTRTDAETFLARVRVELDDGTREIGDPVVTEGVTLAHAIEVYGKHLTEKGLKARPITDRLYRLNTFFPDNKLAVSDLTKSTCAAYYEALRTRVSRVGKTYSVDTHRSMLAEARMLAKFCIGKRWLRASPVEGIEGKGKRRHGKPQLRIDEARRWMAKATELADGGEAGAVAAMMALLLGMRASEIVSRVARDLDDEGRQLWIPDSKTEAGKRTLRVPDVLRPYLRRLTAGAAPDARIFDGHWRDWPREWVQRICTAASVPVVGAHSMRGLHSTLAMEAGVTGAVVAASLGHEKISTTVQSYAKPEAVAGAQQRRALKVLSGGAA